MTSVHFLHIAAAALTVTACAWLNRIAGGGFILWPTGEEGDWLLKRWLPGKPVYWIAPAIGLIAWPWLGWQRAAALSLCAYLVWRLLEWGPYLPMGRGAWIAVRSKFDATIRRVSFGSQRLAMFWRFVITSPGILPLAWLSDLNALAMSVSMPVSAIALWLAYEAGWQGYDRGWWGRASGGGPAAEIIAGAIWGLLIVGVALWTS